MDKLLYPVFDNLRRQGVPLGISEYRLAVQTVRDGVGIESLAQLKRLCGLLWAKSQDDLKLLDRAFSKHIEPQYQTLDEQVVEVLEEPQEEKGLEENKTDTEKIESSRQQDSACQEKPENRQRQSQAISETRTEKAPRRQMHIRPATLAEQDSPHSFPLYQSVKYHMQPRLPVSKRNMAGSWRQFRRFERSGPALDLDVEATLQETAHNGFFLRPILKPRRRNRAELLLLLDRQGSMSVFNPIVNALVESIRRGGMLGRVHCCYFHDCPQKVLFTQANLTRPVAADEVLQHCARNSSVLIISDAGAARGDYDSERLEQTRDFLNRLEKATYLHAWLNPMPAPRWKNNTAEKIAQHTPMFPLGRDGLNDVINILRGQPVQFAINLE
ncbi:MAG: VWA domain-containing protein [Gammaproteobacteria bacterium]|nr:VWA domain-containing protein [Gammaproteobacteria bacterium]